MPCRSLLDSRLHEVLVLHAQRFSRPDPRVLLHKLVLLWLVLEGCAGCPASSRIALTADVSRGIHLGPGIGHVIGAVGMANATLPMESACESVKVNDQAQQRMVDG